MRNAPNPMERLHVAESALATYHAEVERGERPADNLQRLIIEDAVRYWRKQLVEAARSQEPAWQLCHGNQTFTNTEGRA